MRQTSKASLYRREVTDTALELIGRVVARFAGGSFTPEPLGDSRPEVEGILRPAMKQKDRRIEWRKDSAAAIVRKVNAADSYPGVLAKLAGKTVDLYGAHDEGELRGEPGEMIARRNGAVLIGAFGGSVWISHLKHRKKGMKTFKLPATRVLGDAVSEVRESPQLSRSPGCLRLQSRADRDAGAYRPPPATGREIEGHPIDLVVMILTPPAPPPAAPALRPGRSAAPGPLELGCRVTKFWIRDARDSG